ncbi:MAG: HlyD family efflux transporter periplasmic adaptor subunit [Phycisphaerae bacterium]|nr:HlyD family efflux transporter periplasmic adaptor subunit [Phycisphaerae bacterium]
MRSPTFIFSSISLAVALAAATFQAGCNQSEDARVAVADTFVVERSNFDMVIPVSGELAAMKQIEVRNRLESRAVITEVVAEGKMVRKGEVVLRLAEEELRDKIKDAKDKVNTATSEKIAAEQGLSIKKNTRDSELEKADLAIELANLALLAWKEGEVVSKRQSLELAVKTAGINLDRLDARYKESSKLSEQKFISKDECEKDRIAWIEAEVKAKQAKLDEVVYNAYQYKQDEAKKNSDVEQAVAERKRVEQRNDAELVKAQADVESQRFKVESASDRLKQLEMQLGYCSVEAPSDGLVVYATSIDSGGGGRGGGDAQPPQVGTELKPNELVIILPDTSQMVANLKVSEALSGRIRPNQPVTVYSDALPNAAVTGTVQSVSVLAAGGGWRDPNRRDYTVRVALDADPALGLKPSMRCKAEILLDRVDNVVSVPVQAIFRQGPVAYVYVQQGGGFAQKLVKLGRSSELRVEILEGAEEGARVLLRDPAPEEVVAKLDFEKLQQEMPKDDRGQPKAAAIAPPSGAAGGPASAGAGPNGTGERRRGGSRGAAPTDRAEAQGGASPLPSPAPTSAPAPAPTPASK